MPIEIKSNFGLSKFSRGILVSAFSCDGPWVLCLCHIRRFLFSSLLSDYLKICRLCILFQQLVLVFFLPLRVSQNIIFLLQDLEKSSNGKLGIMENSSAVVKSDRLPLLSKDVVMNVNLSKERPNKSCSLVFSNRLMKSRPAKFLIATFAICLGVCAILVHPNQVSKFAVSIRRCLTDRF